MSNKLKFEKYLIHKKDKIKISSKEIKKGDIFLALQGTNFHGNKFIKSSIKKGAKYCITDNKNHIKNTNIICVDNIKNYLIELAKRKRKLYKGKVIGITGSAGKTTLKETLAYFLKKNHTISFSKKSYNNELGVIISILNLNLKSLFSIFEIGTNNFGEIKYLTSIVKPSEIFITNIQSTHLENFRLKSNIAKEKSDIFKSKYNHSRKTLYINTNNKSEKIVLNLAMKENNLKIININKNQKKYFIKDIINKNNYYQIIFSINKKLTVINTKMIINFRLINLLFCYAFFDQNKLNINTIEKRQKYLKPVDGRGLSHNITINKKKIKIIDESYNANPDTMEQSIIYFNNIKKSNLKKILILGDMNELGEDSNNLHINLLKKVNEYNFKFVILCGELLRRSIKKLPKSHGFRYLHNKNNIMNFLKSHVHNHDIILIKCSNSTEINKFANYLLGKGNYN